MKKYTLTITDELGKGCSFEHENDGFMLHELIRLLETVKMDMYKRYVNNKKKPEDAK